MYPRFVFGDVTLPSYGLIVLVSAILVNLIAICIAHAKCMSIKKLLLLELGSGAGAVIGARAVGYILHAYRESAGLATDPQEPSLFYTGGLVGFVLAGALLCKIFRIYSKLYVKELFFLVPLMHAGWKLACWCGGCCGGIWPVPIQLIESALSFLTAILMLILLKRRKLQDPVSDYLILYGLIRVFLEPGRVHADWQTWVVSYGSIWTCILVGIIMAIITHVIQNKEA